MRRRSRRKPDGIDRIVSDLVADEQVLVRWEESDAGRRRWLVVIYRLLGLPAVGYLRGPMNGGHWGHDAEQGEIPLEGWRASGIFGAAPPRVRERLARYARELGIEPQLPRPARGGGSEDGST